METIFSEHQGVWTAATPHRWVGEFCGCIHNVRKSWTFSHLNINKWNEMSGGKKKIVWFFSAAWMELQLKSETGFFSTNFFSDCQKQTKKRYLAACHFHFRYTKIQFHIFELTMYIYIWAIKCPAKSIRNVKEKRYIKAYREIESESKGQRFNRRHHYCGDDNNDNNKRSFLFLRIPFESIGLTISSSIIQIFEFFSSLDPNSYDSKRSQKVTTKISICILYYGQMICIQ